MTMLRYRANVCVGTLQVGECTVHRAANDKGARWWLLWFRVNRDDTGQPADFAVPINPGGGYVEDGPGGKTWGLTRMAPAVWQIAPSINVLASGDLHLGEHPVPSQWHQTPALVDVPAGESWQNSAP